MDEATFLQKLAEQPFDEQLLHDFRTWLVGNGDDRGRVLELEYSRLQLQKKLDDTERKISSSFAYSTTDSAWLDSVLPIFVRTHVAGIFHAKLHPNADSAVNPGQHCHPETILGMVEENSIYHELLAGHRGAVAEIHVASLENVTVGQILFRVARLPQPPIWS